MSLHVKKSVRNLRFELLERRELLAVDIAQSAGLGNEHYYSESAHSLGVVWIDVDNDGYPDIFASNGYDDPGAPLGLRPHLYLNQQDGTFELRDDLLPAFENIECVGAKAADYDRDGDMDLYVYTSHEIFDFTPELNPDDGPANLLLKNNFVESGGSLSGPLFEDVAEIANVDDCPSVPFEGDYGCYQTRSAAFLDYDLDGWQDLYVGHMVMNTSGSISDPDADAHGKIINVDILYRNNGDGTFSKTTDVINAGDATKRGALVTVAGQLTDDMYPDVYVGNAGMHEDMPSEDYYDAILINDGNGHLDAKLVNHGDDTPAAMGIDFADLNEDGRFDIYITDRYDHFENGDDTNKIGNTLYLSTATKLTGNQAPYAMVAAETSWGTNFVDVNLDGREDLFVGLDNGNQSVFYFNAAAGVVEEYIASGRVRGSAIADFDRDRDPDLLLVNQDGGLQLYRNDPTNSDYGRFVVELIPASGVGAIGAVVELTTDNGTVHRRQIKGGTSAHSQDFTREVYFGLGRAQVASVTVRWPSATGLQQTIENPFGEMLTVFERNAASSRGEEGRALAVRAEKMGLSGKRAGDPAAGQGTASSVVLQTPGPDAGDFWPAATGATSTAARITRGEDLARVSPASVDASLDELLEELLTVDIRFDD